MAFAECHEEDVEEWVADVLPKFISCDSEVPI